MKFKTQPYGIHNLIYTYVSGKGSPKYGKDASSEDLKDFEFKASIIVDKTQADKIQKVINDFWKDNKPEKAKAPKSTFLKPEMKPSDTEKDEYGEPVKVPTGNYIVTASTNRVINGKDVTITLLNSKGQKLPGSHPLVTGEVGVGDESTGVIHGTLAVTQFEANAFVKFYLSGIQFAKFVPYTGNNIEADELDVEEDDGCSVEDDGCSVESVGETPNL
jgi:hypothetical protein